MIRFPFILLLVGITLMGCEWIGRAGSANEEDAVVRVYENYLSKEDLQNAIPIGTDSIDSVSMAKAFINTWVETELLVKRAELNLSEEQQNFEDQLRAYRNNLIIYSYEQAIVQQKLDTNISNNEIEEYYNANSQNFELKDYVVKARWIKVDKEAPKLRLLRKILSSEEEKDVKELEDYCYQFAANCQIEYSWMYFDEFKQRVPVQTYNAEQFLKTKKQFEIVGEQFLFLVFISEYKLKNSISPLELEKARIKNILLNKRKLKLLSSIREGLLEEGIAKSNVEYF